VDEIELRLVLVREPDVRNDRVGGKPLLRVGSGRRHDADLRARPSGDCTFTDAGEEARTGTASFWKVDAMPRLRQLTPVRYKCSVLYGITV
jgi:hypothetical protein